MNHFRYLFPVLASMLVASGIGLAQTVKVDAAKNYKFETLKRFAWQSNSLLTMRSPDDNRILDRKIVRTVNDTLAAKGIIEDATHPDFYLFYEGGVADDRSQVGASPTAGEILGPQTPSSASPVTWGAGSLSSAGFAPSVWYSLQGEIVFYVLDSQSRTVVWQGNAKKKWRDVPKARKNEDQEIRQIVGKVFRDFPPKQRK